MMLSTHLSLIAHLAQTPERETAWGQFMQVYQPLILQWCEGQGLQTADSQDVCQSILLSLQNKIVSFDWEKGRFKSWLRVVVRNAVTDFFRLRVRQLPAVGGSSHQDLLNELSSDESIDALCDSLIQSSTDERRMKLAVELTKDQLRSDTSWRAFELRVIQELDTHEIASQLSISVAAVCQAVHRTRKKLKENYTKLLAE